MPKKEFILTKADLDNMENSFNESVQDGLSDFRVHFSITEESFLFDIDPLFRTVFKIGKIKIKEAGFFFITFNVYEK